jgi:hypothetical protein
VGAGQNFKMINVFSLGLLHWVSERNAVEPYATYTVTPESIITHDSLRIHGGGGYSPPTPEQMFLDAQQSQLLLSDEDAASSIDWREHGAVAPVQQQHPFGTCWAMAMTAVSEGVMVVQGKQKLQKLSEQATISCVPATYCGSNSNRLWSWLLKTTGGRLVVEEDYAYNRTCNFFRERQLAPDGTNDGYKGTCNLPGIPPYAPCPPCAGITRRDGTPPCDKATIDPKTATYSNAQVKGWGFVAMGHDGDSTNIVAALNKYGVRFLFYFSCSFFIFKILILILFCIWSLLLLLLNHVFSLRKLRLMLPACPVTRQALSPTAQRLRWTTL